MNDSTWNRIVHIIEVLAVPIVFILLLVVAAFFSGPR